MRRVAYSLLFTLCCSFAWPQGPGKYLVLTNANIVDTREGRVDRNRTVVITGGKIQAVARIGFIQEDRNVQVINAGGKYLIPGLWDMHAHTAGGPAPAWDENIIYPLYVANGVLGIRDMGGDLDLLERRRQKISRGSPIGPSIVMAGPFITGGSSDSGRSDPQVLHVNTADEAHSAIFSLRERGVDFIKILSGLSHDAYLAVADEARRQKIRFAGHVPESVSAAEASAKGQRSIEHLSGLMLACSKDEDELRSKRLESLAHGDYEAYRALDLQTVATYDVDKAREVFIRMTDNNTYNVPTLVWWQANAGLDDAALAKDPALKYVPAGVQAEWARARLQEHFRPGQLQYAKTMAGRYLELVRVMHRMGIPFMAGTDAPDPYVVPGFSLHDELELLVKAGFSNAEALETATFYPALFLVKLDKYGTVEAGRYADLVLLEGNPLEDIRNTRKINAVILHGVVHDRRDLDRMLGRVEVAARKPDVSVAGNSGDTPAPHGPEPAPGK